MSCELTFTKNIALIKSKIKSYYDDNLVKSFNKFLKPQLELWIENEIITPRMDRIKNNNNKEFEELNDRNNFIQPI